MKTFRTTWVAIAALSCLLSTQPDRGRAQSTVDPSIADQLQSQLDGFITQFNLKGLSATVVIPGKGIWNGASGVSHDDVPIDTNMVFSIGSITKTMTAAGILLLQEQGFLSIHDSLHEYLPSYPNIDPNITIKQLLQHTSGIYNYMAHPNYWQRVGSNPWKAIPQDFVLENYIDAPVAEPGEKHDYSNTNYLLLGQIIEMVSGQSYVSFMHDWILDPLELTSFYVAEHEQARGIKPHNWISQSPQDPGTDVSGDAMTSIWGTCAADGAMIANARDMARWAQLLFGGRVLQDSSLKMMTDFMPISIGPLTGYGLGMTRTGSGLGQVWGHNGSIRGWAATLIFSPTDSIIVAIQSNKDNSPAAFALMLMNTARKNMTSAAPREVSGLHLTISSQPNPFSERLELSLEMPSEAIGRSMTVEIFDVLGCSKGRIYDGQVASNKLQIEWRPTLLEAGTYYVVAQLDGSSVTRKVVYEH